MYYIVYKYIYIFTPVGEIAKSSLPSAQYIEYLFIFNITESLDDILYCFLHFQLAKHKQNHVFQETITVHIKY